MSSSQVTYDWNRLKFVRCWWHFSSLGISFHRLLLTYYTWRAVSLTDSHKSAKISDVAVFIFSNLKCKNLRETLRQEVIFGSGNHFPIHKELALLQMVVRPLFLGGRAAYLRWSHPPTKRVAFFHSTSQIQGSHLLQMRFAKRSDDEIQLDFFITKSQG